MKDAFLTTDMLATISKMSPTKRKSAMDIVAKEEFKRCAESIYYWIDPTQHLIPYVYTRDPKPQHECKLCQDGATWDFDKRRSHLLIRHGIEASNDSDLRQHFKELRTLRPFTMKPYFRPLIETWLTERLFAVEKSRDMMATWLFITCYTWDTIFHEGRQNIFQSETASKTLDLIGRVGTIFDNQPAWLRSVWKPKPIRAQGASRAGTFIVPSMQSEIIGFPQGADQIRQYHPSGVLSDECAFNPEASSCFAAIKPAISDGGKYTAISSANEGWFRFLCRDQLDAL